VFRKIGHVLLVVALLGAIGAHWAVLQSVAWTTMLADNLRTTTLAEAVQKTFDGQHPCCLCKQIDFAKKSEKKVEFPGWIKKLEFDVKRTSFTFSAPQNFFLVPDFNDSLRAVAHKPPTPPPRLPAA
jgi:hypothetical protein